MSKQLEPTIIFEDDDLLVLDKPPFWVVNQAESHKHPTLQDWVGNYLNSDQKTSWKELIPSDFDPTYGDPQSIFDERKGMVHRLDKDTSGVIVFAKNPGSLVALLQQFRQRQTHKTYRCLVHGKFKVTEDTISLPIARSNQDRKKFSVNISGRPATTTYKVEEFYLDLDTASIKDKLLAKYDLSKVREIIKKLKVYQGFSLVTCWPKTGRTHQIRVHMTALKHPLVGDSTYTGSKRAAIDALWCPRQFLHAASLTLIHPRTKQEVTFTSPLPADLLEVLTKLTPAD